MPRLAALSLFLLLASAAQAQDLLSGVVWRRIPTGPQLDQLMPAELRTYEFTARAAVECTLRNGAPTGCVLVEEDPQGWGVGEATLKAAPLFEAEPRTRAGVRTEGRRIRLPIVWRTDGSRSGEAHGCAVMQLIEDAAAAQLKAPPADALERTAAALRKQFPAEYPAGPEAARRLGFSVEILTIRRADQPVWRRAFALCRERQPQWLTRPEPAAYQPPSGTAPREILRPLYVAVGEPPSLDRYFPERARQAGVAGRAEVLCTVGAEGRVQDCKVLSESPGGWGFGAALARAAGEFRLDARDRDGWPVAGREIRMDHAFDPAAAVRAERPAPRPAGPVRVFQADQDFTFTGGLLERMRFRQGELLPVIGRRTIDGVDYLIVVKDRKYAVLVGPDGALHPKVYNAIGWNNGAGTMVWNFKANPADARLTPIGAR